MIKKISYIVFISAILIYCKKDKTLWNVNNKIPLANADIRIQDFLTSSNYLSDSNNILNFHYSDTLGIDYLNIFYNSFDTSFSDTFRSPLNINAYVSANQSIFNSYKNIILKFNDSKIKYIKLKKLNLKLNISNYFRGNIEATLWSNDITDENNNIFEKKINIDSLSNYSQTINLKNIDMNLYKINELDKFGNLKFYIKIKTSPNQNDFLLIPSDFIKIDISLYDFEIDYIEGYLGKFNVNQAFNYEPTYSDLIKNNDILLKEFDLRIKLENYIGLDYFLKFNDLKFLNENNESTTLNMPFDEIDIARATKKNNIIQSTTKISQVINQNNSNIISGINSKPKKITGNFDIKINPLGNLSFYNDFIDLNKITNIIYDVKIPLKFDVNYVKIKKSFTINNTDFLKNIHNSTLYIKVQNNYNIDYLISASTKNYTLNINNNYIKAKNSQIIKLQLNQHHIDDIINTKTIIIDFLINENQQDIDIFDYENILINIYSELNHDIKF